MTTDRDEIVELTTRMLWHTDRREWDALHDVFADKVRLDYTSLAGGEPAVLTPQQIIDAWRSSLGGLDATQHLMANHLVSIDGERAEVSAQFQAVHVLANPHGAPTWTLGGHYRFGVRRAGGRWRIEAVTMTADWASGNQQIMTLATPR